MKTVFSWIRHRCRHTGNAAFFLLMWCCRWLRPPARRLLRNTIYCRYGFCALGRQARPTNGFRGQVREAIVLRSWHLSFPFHHRVWRETLLCCWWQTRRRLWRNWWGPWRCNAQSSRFFCRQPSNGLRHGFASDGARSIRWAGWIWTAIISCYVKFWFFFIKSTKIMQDKSFVKFFS